VTETRARHAQQLTQDWLAGVGTLAAGVAHELNNPTAYVASNLAFALEELAPLRRGEPLPERCAPEVLEALDEAREGAGQISRIVHDLRTFTREHQDARGPVDVKEVLEVALRLTERELHHRARVVREDAPGALSAWGNAGQLAQVLVQLLLNAAQALPEGEAERHAVHVAARGEPEGWVSVSVRDTGHGIPQEHLSRLFTPFFTTRAPGQGQGLGLFISHNLVKGMGGSIRVRSTPGQGSTFQVLVPCTPTPTAPLPAAEPAGPEPRSRLLLLDDDARVCKAFERLLRPYHDVTTFQRAHAALEWLRAGAPVDVLFCDLALPDMSGLELYRALLQLRPELLARVVLVTGGANAPAARALLDTIAQRRLDKPFERDQVLQRVREVRGGARYQT
jgi:CheY-like chemotaxis protein